MRKYGIRCTNTFFFITFNFVETMALISGNKGKVNSKKLFKSQSNNPAPCRYVGKYLARPYTKQCILTSYCYFQLFYANSNSYQFRVYFFIACIISNTFQTFRMLNYFRQYTISENGPYLLTLIFERRLFTWLNIGDMVVF